MKELKTQDIRLASLVWLFTGECPEVTGDYPKVFVFPNHPELKQTIRGYYSEQGIQVKVSELFDRYNALRNLIRLEMEGGVDDAK
jgi:hypothetical protein